MSHRPFDVPPGHMPMVLLTPQQYLSMNEGLRRPSYFTYGIMFRTAQGIQDFFKAAVQSSLIDKLSANVRNLTVQRTGLSYQATKLSLPELATTILDAIENDGVFLDTAWKAGIGGGMGAAYSSAIEQYLSTGQLLYAYKKLQLQISVTSRMKRYWNAMYTPAVPNFLTAWQMWRRGLLTKDDVYTYGSYDGWTKEWIDKLMAVTRDIPNPQAAFRMYTRAQLTRKQLDAAFTEAGWDAEWHDKLVSVYEWLPTAHEAWYMWKKGLLSAAQKNRLYSSQGYDARWHAMMDANYEYIPTLYDLTRMADYVELDLPWMTEILRKRGVSARDIVKITESLQIRPLREERRDIITIWLRRYRLGRCSIDEFREAMQDLGILTTERGLLVINAELQFQDELVDEAVDVLTWQFRTAIISQADFEQGLLDLGIRQEKANLMVEAELARGYYGYY